MENNDTVQGRFEKMRRVLNFGSINIDNVYTVEHFPRWKWRCSPEEKG